MVLIVSGGHTELVLMKDHLHYQRLGGYPGRRGWRGVRQGRPADRAGLSRRAGDPASGRGRQSEGFRFPPRLAG